MRRAVPKSSALVLVIICAASVLGMLLLYVFDNKYTAQMPQGQQGILCIDNEENSDNSVFFLIEGWEYYAGKLLTPKDFVAGTIKPDAYIYIGQYGGFEANHFSSSPHGSASYRLRVILPPAKGPYLLEIPEIFSAYRLYINGEEAAAMGDPDPASYKAQTGNRTISISKTGKIEILVAVSDFSHLYSGMVYPPAFGMAQSVTELLNTRLIIRSIFAAFALAVGLISALVGLLTRKNRLAILYGLLCLFFVGFTGYTIVRSVGSGSPALYGIEMFSFCAMLTVVTLIQNIIYGKPTKLVYPFIAFGIFMCVFSAMLPLLLPMGKLWIMAVYTFSVSVFEIVTALFITVSAGYSLLRGRSHSLVLLCGLLVFDVSLVMDRVLPLYEPIVGGWFYEISSFALILSVGIVVGQELASKYKENAILLERQSGMERLVDMQKTNYEILMEKVEETKAVRHDMRHHFMMISGFVQKREYEKLETYIVGYEASFAQNGTVGYTSNVVADVLLKHYERAAIQHNIDYSARVSLGRDVGVADTDLCAVLSNLLENAVEACMRVSQGKCFIKIHMNQENSMLAIQVENSAEDSSISCSGASFLSSKANGRVGYGLSSIQAITKRYGGYADFAFQQEERLFISTVLLMESVDGKE